MFRDPRSHVKSFFAFGVASGSKVLHLTTSP